MAWLWRRYCNRDQAMRQFHISINNHPIPNTRDQGEPFVAGWQNVLHLIGGYPLFAGDDVAKSGAVGTVEQNFAADLQPINVGKRGWNLGGFAKTQDMTPQHDIFALAQFGAVDVPADIVVGNDGNILGVQANRYQLAVEIDLWNDQAHRGAVANRWQGWGG